MLYTFIEIQILTFFNKKLEQVCLSNPISEYKLISLFIQLARRPGEAIYSSWFMSLCLKRNNLSVDSSYKNIHCTEFSIVINNAGSYAPVEVGALEHTESNE